LNHKERKKDMASELIRISLPDVTQEVTLGHEWFQKRDEALAESGRYIVATAANADEIGDMTGRLGKMASRIEAERKKITAPFLAAQKTIKATVDKAVEPLAVETMRLKGLLAEFAEAERRRLAEEARKAEMERLAREAAEAERQRQEEALFGSSVSVTVIEPEQPQQAAPKVDGVRLSEAVVFEVLDESLIPAQFLTFDPAKLRAWIAERKDMLLEQLRSENFKQPIDGVELRIESKVAIR
jgi:hypothetical protein